MSNVTRYIKMIAYICKMINFMLLLVVISFWHQLQNC
jgi:hypothetical protein